jgi:hypothetical protein
MDEESAGLQRLKLLRSFIGWFINQFSYTDPPEFLGLKHKVIFDRTIILRKLVVC